MKKSYPEHWWGIQGDVNGNGRARERIIPSPKKNFLPEITTIFFYVFIWEEISMLISFIYNPSLFSSSFPIFPLDGFLSMAAHFRISSFHYTTVHIITCS